MSSLLRTRLRVVGTTVALLAGMLIVSASQAPLAGALPGPIAEPGTGMVSADALPTAQINGVVWQQAIVGNTVYAGGSFTLARPAGAGPGTQEVTRSNLMAYNITNGVMTSFAPTLNGQVRAVTAAPDGSRIYVGGDFTTVNGVTKTRIAAFNTSDGSLITSFDANVNYTVRAIVATNDTVYVGGAFTTSRGQTRNRLAAFTASTGTLTAWAPNSNAVINAMVMAPDGSKLIVGGAFSTMNGSNVRGMTALRATDGVVQTWQANQLIQNSGTNSAILSLTTDGTSVYGTGYRFGSGGNLEGTFRADPSNGAIRWIQDCHGDTYDVAASGGVVYTVSHAHFCGNIGGFWQSEPWSTNMRHALAFTEAVTGTIDRERLGYFNFEGNPSPSLYNWYPDMANGSFTGLTQAAWDVTANDNYVVMGGEFPTVNNAGQQGLVRFAKRSSADAPKRQGPRVTGASFAPRVVSLSGDSVRVSWQTNWDRDDLSLTYRVIRDNNTADPVATVTADATFWRRPSHSFVDTGLSPGSHNYRIQAVDRDGNTVTGNPVSVTPSANAISGYERQVLGDGAAQYWRLEESSGSTAFDTAGLDDGDISNVTRNTPGAIAGDSGTATTFTNALDSRSVNRAPVQGPDVFTMEAWFRSGTTTGGRIAGFSSHTSQRSNSYDRQIYMDNAGRIVFGVNNGNARTVNSAAAYNNNQWHHVVATLGPTGINLYVDGNRVANRADVTTGQYFQGYWRIGADQLSGWPNRPTTDFFSGAIDDVAIYPTVLSAAKVLRHYQFGAGVGGNQNPVAAFTTSVDQQTVAVNGSGSSDPDGSVTGWSWNWGDDTPNGSGSNASHAYASPGTYTVNLTVTDNQGGTGTTSRQVVIAPPPSDDPVASFTASASGRTVTVNGTASADPGGFIVSYSWNWGDGTTNGSGATASHPYGQDGQYTITLTVTDDQGNTGTTSQQVTATENPALDTFDRTVSNGWGTAEVGGPWTPSNAARFAVAENTGRITMTAAGQAATATLGALAVRDLDAVLDFTVDKPATGSGVYTTVSTRLNGTSNYQFTLKFLAGGGVNLAIGRTVNGAATQLGSVVVPGLTFAPGDTIRLRFRTIGDVSTALAVKAWKVGTAEPGAFTLTRTDSTASLQGAGALSIQAYLSSSSTNAPVVGIFDNLAVSGG